MDKLLRSKDQTQRLVESQKETIERLQNELETIKEERQKLLFNQPTRKAISTSVDMEIQKKVDEIQRLNRTIDQMKKDEKSESVKQQERFSARERNLQAKLDEKAQRICELEAESKEKVEEIQKKYDDVIFEMQANLKRMSAEILNTNTECGNSLALKESEIEKLQRQHQQAIQQIRSDLIVAQAEKEHRMSNEFEVAMTGKKQEFESLLSDLRLKLHNEEVEKVALERTLVGRIYNLEDSLNEKKTECARISEESDRRHKKITELNNKMAASNQEYAKIMKEKDEAFEVKLNLERDNSDNELKMLRESTMMSQKEKDSEISTFKIALMESKNNHENLMTKAKGDLAKQKNDLENKLNDARKDCENKLKERMLEIEEMQIAYKKKSENLKETIEKLKHECEVNKSFSIAEKTQIQAAHKKHLSELSEQYKAELKLQMEGFKNEKADLLNTIKSVKESKRLEVSELQKKKLNLEQELQQCKDEHALQTNLSSVEIQVLKDAAEVQKKEYDEAAKKFLETIMEIESQKNEEINFGKAKYEKEVWELNCLIEEKQKVNEKIQLEMTQKFQKLSLEFEKTKSDYEFQLNKKDVDLQNFKSEVSRNTESLRIKHTTELEERVDEIRKLELRVKETEAQWSKEVSRLVRDAEMRMDEVEGEKRELLDIHCSKLNKINQDNLHKLKEARQSFDEELRAVHLEVRERNNRIKELENELSRSQGKMEEAERSAEAKFKAAVKQKDAEIQGLLDSMTHKEEALLTAEKAHKETSKSADTRWRSHVEELQSELQALKREMEEKVRSARQQALCDLNAKDEEMAEAGAKLERAKAASERLECEYQLRIKLLKDEHVLSTSALKDQHTMELRLKEEEEESLREQIIALQGCMEKEAGHFKELVDQYRNEFHASNISLEAEMESLRAEKAEELRRLNADINKLQEEKVKLLEEMKNEEIQLTERHFNEICTLKTSFMKVHSDLEQKLHQTEEALNDVTLERNILSEENKRRVQQIEVLERNEAKLKKQIEEKVREMSEAILRLNDEKKQMFHELQSSIEKVLEEKSNVESRKDHALNETKIAMESDFREIKKQLDSRIDNLEAERNALEDEVKRLKLDAIKLIEQQDAERARLVADSSQKCQAGLDQVYGEQQSLVRRREEEIERLRKELKEEIKRFGKSTEELKLLHEKQLKERDEFIEKLREEHLKTKQELEAHMELIKTDLSCKDKEVQETQQGVAATLSQKNEELASVMSEIARVKNKLALAEADSQLADSRATEIGALEIMLKEKHDEISNIKSVITNLQENEMEHKGTVQQLTAEIVGFRNRITENEAEMRDIKYKLQAAEKYAISLCKDIEEKDRKIGEVYQKYQKEKYQSTAKGCKIEDLKKMSSAFSDEITKKEEVICSLQKKLDIATYSSGMWQDSRWDLLKTKGLIGNQYSFAPRFNPDGIN